MTKHYTFIANFKMNLSYNQEIAYITNNYQQLFHLAAKPDQTIIIAPSALSIAPVAVLLKGSNVGLASQDSSPYQAGSYTGQLSAQSLYEAGCRYGIVGHSETRAAYQLSNESVVERALQLAQANISPIVCCGEAPGQDWQTVLNEQLTPLFSAFAPLSDAPTLYIAYEPLSAIGTGNVPSLNDLEEVFTFLANKIEHHSIFTQVKLIYGGSVKSSNIVNLLEIRAIDGFLVGNASLDFQEFEKIVD